MNETSEMESIETSKNHLIEEIDTEKLAETKLHTSLKDLSKVLSSNHVVAAISDLFGSKKE